MRRSIVVAIVLGSAVGVSACASAPAGPKVSPPPGPHLTVVAKDLAFDTNGLTMTADQPTLIYFENLEDAPHDIEIQTEQNGGANLFDGEIINKGAIVYTVPPLPAGGYFFLCEVHPNMHGVVTVTP